MPRRQLLISDTIKAKLKQARIARLTTLDTRGEPHIVPICFAYNGRIFYTWWTGSPNALHQNDWLDCDISRQNHRLHD
jgi:nitroimidazol reductase NimA-like FMN-containing flavoprotein (pyridoxamine 5'-phosphate oxidase superfamily)